MSNFSRRDNDFCTWMMLNQEDLFPNIETDEASRPQSGDINQSASVLPRLNSEHKVDIHRMSKNATDNHQGIEPDILNEKERKKQERLIRNREIARNCRKRKREKINAMEIELKELKEANRNLELKVAQLQQNKVITKKGRPASEETTEPALPSNEARNLEYAKIAILLENYDKAKEKGLKDEVASIQAKVQDKLTLCEEMHSDFGNARKNEVEFHMNQLESLLIPNQLTKISLWSLQQEDDFYDEKTKNKTFGGGLWNTLCTEFNLTTNQKRELINMRMAIRAQRNNIYECLKILNELKGRVKKNFNGLKDQMKKILSITTPIQQARFLMWMEKNQACMFMLNSLWEKEKAKKIPGSQDSYNTQEDDNKIANQNLKDETSTGVSIKDMDQAFESSRSLRAMQEILSKQKQSTDV